MLVAKTPHPENPSLPQMPPLLPPATTPGELQHNL